MSSISVVMPLYQARALLPRVLPPLVEALGRGDVQELLVVDDGSTDGGAELARELGARVLSSGGRLGPGGARNVGVEEAAGDVVLFVDSDVVMHADVPERVRAALADEDVVAVFGSYDDRPAARGLVSQYLNLRHHLVHQRAAGEAATFWAGCGAVRRDAFRDVGGFDLRRFPRPSIEDIDLGYRLRGRGGRILLDPELQGTHLKRWTLGSMVATDVFQRALPWLRLMRERGIQDSNLNASRGEQAKALLALGFWASLPLTLGGGLAGGLPFVLLAGAWAANRDLFGLVWRRNDVFHALAALVLHQLYYAYGVVCWGWVQVESRLGGAGRTQEGAAG